MARWNSPRDLAIEPAVDFRLLSDDRDLVRLADAFRLSASLLHTVGQAGACSAQFPSTCSARVKRWLRPGGRNRVLMAMVAPVMDVLPAVRRQVLRITQEDTPPLAALCADETMLHAHLRRHVGGVWHPSGTCRMGAADDPLAVCDAQGRVIGTENLIISDASVTPTIPCANLNIPVLMIAEKMADGIRARMRA